jgi:hypothetical protein
VSNTSKEALEILNDAKDSPRLTEFENSFVRSLLGGFKTPGAVVTLTERQWYILRQIERKIYRAG